MALDEGLLGLEGKGSGRLLFSGCQILLNGVVNTPCEPRIGAEKGVFATNALKSQLVVHEGATLARIEPVAGTTFASVATGAECPVGSKISIGGVFYAKDSNGKFEIVQEAHPLQEGPLTALWVISNTAEHKATVDGSASVSLAGAHLYRWWGGSADLKPEAPGSPPALRLHRLS